MPDDAGQTATQISNSQINAPVTTGSNNQITIYHVAEGAVVHVDGPGTRLAIQPLPLPRDLRAQPFAGLQGRESEVAAATAALTDGRVVEVFGPSGVGKTSLLRFLEYEPVADRFPDGVIHLYQGALPALDQLQALYEAFYTAVVPYKPTESAARQSLREKRALVVIDDAERSREELEQLRGWMPAATFLFASVERRLFGEGEAIPLQGLKRQAAVALFEREVGRPLTSAEWPDATALCETLQGLPLRLKEAAQEVKAGKALADLARAPRAPGWAKLLQLSEADILSLLGQEDEAKVLLDALREGALADGGWSEAVERFLAAMERLMQTKERKEPRALLLLLSVRLAGDAGMWPVLVRLVRSASELLLTGRFWATWQSVVEAALEAAVRLGDRAGEAWALHQLGAHALCMEQLERANSLLTRAEALRLQLGDEAGLAVTRQNLKAAQVLGGSVTPPVGSTGKASPAKWLRAAGTVGLLMAAAVAGVVAGARWVGPPERRPLAVGRGLLAIEMAQLDFGVGDVRSSIERSVLLRNRGEGAAEVDGIELSGDTGFQVVDLGGCQRLGPGEACTLRLQFAPPGAGRATGALTVRAKDGEPIKLDLTGEGRESPASSTKPEIAIDPPFIDFGIVAVGTPMTQTVRLTNVGSGSLFLDEVTTSLSGLTADPNCGRILAPHQTCGVAVTFQATAAGVQSGVVTLRDLTANQATEVKVTATGGVPDLVVTEFAAGARVPTRVVIQNRGTAPAPVFKVAVFVTGSPLTSGDGTDSLVPFIIDGDTGQPTPFTKGPLGPGEKVVLQGDLRPGRAGTLFVEADSCFAEPPTKFCRVQEQDESNNRRTIDKG